ncbi:MAG: hypothetical protein CVU08_04830 [Bacteroidetes bacterium HGW-Bacteroidetes-3]|jgi:hypothetical protein|nr:MAG: hypothetical protein CVU08_04830 [Bacteroidetes bacterium HGW-Bacteroidetes-3]
MRNALDKEYLEHCVFGQLADYADFYRSLSDSTMSWISQGTNSAINIDTYVFSSMQGTLESINDILFKGRINDAYALLRKYYDATIINLYSNLYLSDNFSIDNFIVEKINNWVKGKETIPSFGKMSEYIIKSPKVSEITQLVYSNGAFKGSSFEELRQRCNDHTHYLYYHNLLSNDNEVYLQNRLATLDSFSKDLKDIFILHLSYLFYQNDHYMMSSDYVDSLDCGLTPEEDSQYWVASFIQDIFNKVIKVNRPDIAETIKGKTAMKLE